LGLKRILILGAGAQGQCIANAILLAAKAGQPVTAMGYLDDNPELCHKQVLGLPVFGPLKALADMSYDSVILGIGNNRLRGQLYEKLTSQGIKFITIVNPTALIGQEVSIGPGTFIGGYVIVDIGTTIGANVIIHGGSVIGHHNIIGDHVHIAPGVHTAGQVSIGAAAMIGIGTNIIPQRSVGSWAVIGGGSLVNRNVPNNVTVAGVPAKPLDRPGIKISKQERNLPSP